MSKQKEKNTRNLCDIKTCIACGKKFDKGYALFVEKDDGYKGIPSSPILAPEPEASSAFYWSYSTLDFFNTDDYARKTSQRVFLKTRKQPEIVKNESNKLTNDVEVIPQRHRSNSLPQSMYNPLPQFYDNPSSHSSISVHTQCSDNIFSANDDVVNELPFEESPNNEAMTDDDDNSQNEKAQNEFINLVNAQMELENSILPIYEAYLMDTESKLVMLPHLYDLCEAMTPTERNCMAKKLGEYMLEDVAAFRVRDKFADQLIKMFPLYDAHLTNEYFSGIAFIMAADKISIVRDNGIDLLVRIVSRMMKEELYASGYNEDSDDDERRFLTTSSLLSSKKLLYEIRINFLWATDNWRKRQSYGRLLYTLLSKKLCSDVLFSYFCIQDLLALSRDPVANVRQYFYKIIELTIPTSNAFTFDAYATFEIRKRLLMMVDGIETDSENLSMANELVVQIYMNNKKSNKISNV